MQNKQKIIKKNFRTMFGVIPMKPAGIENWFCNEQKSNDPDLPLIASKWGNSIQSNFIVTISWIKIGSDNFSSGHSTYARGPQCPTSQVLHVCMQPDMCREYVLWNSLHSVVTSPAYPFGVLNRRKDCLLSSHFMWHTFQKTKVEEVLGKKVCCLMEKC